MAATFSFRVLTPERTVLEGEMEEVILRAEGGDIAFLAGHVQFIAEVEPSVVRALRPDQREDRAAVHGGFVEVRGEEVTVLASVAELPDEIDVARATRSKQQAESRLAATADDTEADAALQRANARLDLAGRL